MTRRIAYVVSLAVVVWAAVVVPVPFYEVQPGSARPVDELVTLDIETTPINGELDLLTTRISTPGFAEAAWIALVPDRELEPTRSRAPGELDLDVYLDLQDLAFETSFLTAVAVAAEEAGYTVELATRAIVAHVLPDGPSDGVLQAGDTITAVDGTAVASAVDLVDELATDEDDRTVTLDIVRSGDPMTVEVTMRRLPEAERPVIGIVAETVADEPQLPFAFDLDRKNISGPSAGLMLALAATDLLLEEDLTRGRVIAGTGTISIDGRVGPVSGVEQKTLAAIEAGADLLLVPVDALPATAAATEAGIEVVGVETFQDALDAVRGDTGDGLAASR